MSTAQLLENKIAIVTGAGRGIGRVAALALANAGAHVVVVARSQRAIEAVAGEIRARGGQALAIPADVSDPASVDLMVLQTLRAAGRIDILINNAGVIAPMGMTWEVPPLIWQRNISVNLVGVFVCSQAVLPHMIHQEAGDSLRGKIINASSGAASHPVPGWSAYCAAKAGVDQFTRVLAAELESHAIAVIGARSGIVDTQIQTELRHVLPDSLPDGAHSQGTLKDAEPVQGLFEMGQLRSPEEAARFLLWLASPFADDLTGQIVSIQDETVRRRMVRDLGAEPLPGLEQ